ncbi:MAG: nuclear transport factor 2 family protein, partial [Eudoraea sp.]|nr:nuclear transport factor 2 family protein [Eudoraea sp.]
DILIYDIKGATRRWLSDSPEASEYSPLKIPSKNAVSAIGLDKDGKQLLYSHDLTTGETDVLIENLKVGYHLWYSANILIAAVLVNNRMDLVVVNTEDNSKYTFQKNVGRSLQQIPNSNLVSYISKEDEGGVLKSLDPISGATVELMTMPPGVEDIAWLADGTALAANGKFIARFNLDKDKQWEVIYNFKEKEINNLTRMAISPDQNYIALVSDESPEIVIDKQVTSFNTGDLEAFVSCFSDAVEVKNFPADTLYTGRENLRVNYRQFLAKNPETKVEVTRRIIIGNKVIDAETATVSGKSHQQVAIYEVDSGSISSMVFIHENTVNNRAESIVQQQLDAYNKRDIDGFMGTYSKAVKLYNYPGELVSEGWGSMYKSYASFFKDSPDLNCEIMNRMVIGNKVIDEELISTNGSTFSAVAIYEIENDKIAKVTFLR